MDNIWIFLGIFKSIVSCVVCEKFTWNGNQIDKPSYQFHSEYVKQNASSVRILDVKTAIL